MMRSNISQNEMIDDHSSSEENMQKTLEIWNKAEKSLLFLYLSGVFPIEKKVSHQPQSFKLFKFAKKEKAPVSKKGMTRSNSF